ncbi:MAG: hypothetical protein ACRD0N_10810 [Acidimicrobiales bacterium]
MRDLDLYRGLEQVLGAPVATALMGRLPAQPADELATRNHVAALGTGLAAEVTPLKTDVATLKTGVATLKTDVATLKTDVATLKTDVAVLDRRLTGEVAALGERMTREFALVREEMTGEFALVREEMTGGFALLREEMTAMKHELVATFRGEMVHAIHTQGRQLAFTLAGSMVGLSGLAFAISNLAA